MPHSPPEDRKLLRQQQHRSSFLESRAGQLQQYPHQLMCLWASWRWQLQVILMDGKTGVRGLGEKGRWFDSERAATNKGSRCAIYASKWYPAESAMARRSLTHLPLWASDRAERLMTTCAVNSKHHAAKKDDVTLDETVFMRHSGLGRSYKQLILLTSVGSLRGVDSGCVSQWTPITRKIKLAVTISNYWGIGPMVNRINSYSNYSYM